MVDGQRHTHATTHSGAVIHRRGQHGMNAHARHRAVDTLGKKSLVITRHYGRVVIPWPLIITAARVRAGTTLDRGILHLQRRSFATVGGPSGFAAVGGIVVSGHPYRSTVRWDTLQVRVTDGAGGNVPRMQVQPGIIPGIAQHHAHISWQIRG